MNSKYAPGPWYASRKSNFVNTTHNQPVAVVCDQPTREADAKLLAGSLDLLEAAKKSRAALEFFTTSYRDPAGLGLFALNAIDSAIAKIEGRSE